VGLDAELLSLAQRTPAGTGASGRCLQEQRRVVIEDVEQDPAFTPYLTRRGESDSARFTARR
jgi:hypothetical protein